MPVLIHSLKYSSKSYLNWLQLSVVLGFGCLFGACDGGGTEAETFAIVSVPSNLKLILPDGVSTRGTLQVLDKQQVEIINRETSDLLTEQFELAFDETITINFKPQREQFQCFASEGCGHYLTPSQQDLNNNERIDFGEHFTHDFIYQARITIIPGNNTVYLSPFSTLLVEVENEATTEATKNLGLLLQQLALTAAPFFHEVELPLSKGEQFSFLASAFNTAFFTNYFLAGEDKKAQLKRDLMAIPSEGVKRDTPLGNWLENTITVLNQYSLERDDLNADSLKSLATVRHQVMALFNDAYPVLSSQSVARASTDRLLLQEWRDVLALLSLHDVQYAGDVQAQLDGIFALIDEETISLFSSLVEIIASVFVDFSPLSEAQSGIYNVNNLIIDYRLSPLTWRVSGSHKSHDIDLQAQVPEWRISAARGDRLVADVDAAVSATNKRLALDTDNLLIQFDRTEDLFSGERAKTFIGKIASAVSISDATRDLTGYLNVSVNRLQYQGVFPTTLPFMSFSAESVTDQLNMLVSATDLTPIIDDDTRNLSFAVTLDMPIAAAPNFRLMALGDIESIQSMQYGKLNMVIKQSILEMDLDLRVEGDESVLIRGNHGRWLHVYYEDELLKGGLFHGAMQIGQVKSVRGVPGILFTDGTFESLF